MPESRTLSPVGPWWNNARIRNLSPGGPTSPLCNLTSYLGFAGSLLHPKMKSRLLGRTCVFFFAFGPRHIRLNFAFWGEGGTGKPQVGSSVIEGVVSAKASGQNPQNRGSVGKYVRELSVPPRHPKSRIPGRPGRETSNKTTLAPFSSARFRWTSVTIIGSSQSPSHEATPETAPR